MAERRMFSNNIINSAKFLRMPNEAQNLYFHLGMRADDDGVVEGFTVLRQTGINEDNLKVLAMKGFVKVLNDDLVTFITDWTEHNKLRADRKKDSIYKELLLKVCPQIELKKSKPRSDRLNGGTSQGQPMDGIGKDRLGKDSLGKERILLIEEEENPSSIFEEIFKNYKVKTNEQTIKNIVKLNPTKERVEEVAKHVSKNNLDQGALYNIIKENRPLKEPKSTPKNPSFTQKTKVIEKHEPTELELILSEISKTILKTNKLKLFSGIENIKTMDQANEFIVKNNIELYPEE